MGDNIPLPVAFVLVSAPCRIQEYVPVLLRTDPSVAIINFPSARSLANCVVFVGNFVAPIIAW